MCLNESCIHCKLSNVYQKIKVGTVMSWVSVWKLQVHEDSLKQSSKSNRDFAQPLLERVKRIQNTVIS
jgi:hypothetical protein